jgi:sugar lactone lactonase YvrE
VDEVGTIRKIEIDSGDVTTLAGTTGVSGSADGTGTLASFYNPSGIAIDSSGNLYVADDGNHTIRKITSSGAVTTLAGSAGAFGSVDGTGTSARFMEAQGIATDSSGNLYVSDSSKMGNSSIRKITSSGVVTTLAGRGGNLVFANGTGAAALFNMPYSIATDNSGNLYVCDTYNFIIRKTTSSGVVTTLAGTAGLPGWADGTGSAARFFWPIGIVIDPTNTYLYVVDVVGAIRKIVIASGVVTTLAGSMGSDDSADGIGTSASFSEPQAIAIDPTNTYLYVVDDGIRKINISTKEVTTIPGVLATYGDQLALDLQGNIYVSSSSTNSISKITPEGVQSIFVPSSAGLNNPMGIKIDSDGNLFVADSGNSEIKKITPDGIVSTFLSLPAPPIGIAIDSSGNLYITDMNSIIRKIE